MPNFTLLFVSQTSCTAFCSKLILRGNEPQLVNSELIGRLSNDEDGGLLKKNIYLPSKLAIDQYRYVSKFSLKQYTSARDSGEYAPQTV